MRQRVWAMNISEIKSIDVSVHKAKLKSLSISPNQLVIETMYKQKQTYFFITHGKLMFAQRPIDLNWFSEQILVAKLSYFHFPPFFPNLEHKYEQLIPSENYLKMMMIFSMKWLKVWNK